jgi:hypothetical protein
MVTIAAVSVGHARNPALALHRVPVLAATAHPVLDGWSDTVHVDAINGYSLAVHSVRHPEFAPYTVDVDASTIVVPLGGPLAPTPGMHVGSNVYFTATYEYTGTTPIVGTPPSRVRAVRIFYSDK